MSAAVMRIPDNSAAATLAYEEIKKRITELRYPPGTKLSEIQLVEELGYGRSPIRTAFARLQNDGWVSVSPQSGTYVKRLSEAEIKEIYDFRLLLEIHATRLAAQNMTAEQLRKLRTAFRRLAPQAGDRFDEAMFDDINELDAMFHAAVYRASGNSLITGILLNLLEKVQWLKKAAPSPPQRMKQWCAELESVWKRWKGAIPMRQRHACTSISGTLPTRDRSIAGCIRPSAKQRRHRVRRGAFRSEAPFWDRRPRRRAPGARLRADFGTLGASRADARNRHAKRRSSSNESCRRQVDEPEVRGDRRRFAADRRDRHAGAEQSAHDGFEGTIYPVNPRYDTIDGLKCWPSLSALPAPVDAAFLAVPAAAGPELADEAGRCGIKALFVNASGYADGGVEGVALQRRLEAVADRHGIVLAGPNNMGLVNVHDRKAMWTQQYMKPIAPGPVGVIAQSGTIALILIEDQRDLGFAYLVTTGNEAGATAADYLYQMVEDDRVKVILLFLETIRKPRLFAEAAAEAARRGKRIIALKVGASDGGRALVQAHTGSLAGEDRLYEAYFKAHGVVRVRDLDEMLETAVLFCANPALPPSAHVAAVTLSGGEAALLSDIGGELGLDFMALGPETLARLRPAFPDYATIGNPIDAWGSGLRSATIPTRRGRAARRPGARHHRLFDQRAEPSRGGRAVCARNCQCMPCRADRQARRVDQQLGGQRRQSACPEASRSRRHCVFVGITGGAGRVAQHGVAVPRRNVWPTDRRASCVGTWPDDEPARFGCCPKPACRWCSQKSCATGARRCARRNGSGGRSP